jgi:hypothetical protein
MQWWTVPSMARFFKSHQTAMQHIAQVNERHTGEQVRPIDRMADILVPTSRLATPDDAFQAPSITIQD